jgi:FKBP-type peptidyl-prolyl cis-trans isomerase SlyD
MSDEHEAGSADDSDAEDEAAPDVESDVEDATTDAEEDATDGFADGDFVRLDYTVRLQDGGDVIDTTRKEVAEEAEIDTEDHEFGPRTVIVGAGHVFEAVDEALHGAAVGDTDTVDVSAAEAFGEFDPENVRTVSAEKLDEESRFPGAQVTIDGQQGRVETVIGGRARVDFNHPLAGEDIEYEYEVVGAVADREERAAGMLDMYLEQTPELWIQTDTVEEEQVVESDADDDEGEPETETVEVETETLYIEATPGMTMNQQWMFSKQQIAQEMMDRLDLDRVIVQETIEGGGMGPMGGMMGGMGGMGGASAEDIEEAIEDVDVDADEIAEELDAGDLDAEE